MAGLLLLLSAALLPAAASAAGPDATTTAASGITEKAATVRGIVNPTGIPTTFYFEYGTTTAYGSKTSESSAGSSSSNVEVFKSLEGLAAGTTYHYRIVATNFFGTAKGADETFTTTSSKINTLPATGIWTKEATLNGEVNPQGVSGTYWFEYGTTEAYGSKTKSTGYSGTFGFISVGASLTGLSPATTYHFRVVMESSKGEVNKGGDRKFTTVAHAWYLQTMPHPSETTVPWGVSCSSGSDCIAVGRTSENELAEHWNGTEWTTMSISGAGTLQEISCTSSSACTAVGSSGGWADIKRWNGSEWKAQTSAAPSGAVGSSLAGVWCTSSTFCIAVGGYSNGGESLPWSETWNGSEWKAQTMLTSGIAPNTIHDVSCTSSSACTAVGSKSGAALIERWNGTEWALQTPANLASNLESVSCASSTFCMAVESAYSTSWNGSEWKNLEAPLPAGTVRASLGGVSCPSTTTCHAAGWYEVASGVVYTLAELWNGSKWELQERIEEPAESIASGVNDVSCVSATLCEAVGHYNSGPIWGYAERYE